jgi:protocatechuate 3,4-dioxygenase beta subunit
VEVWPPATVHHVLLERGVLLEGQVLTHAGAPAAGARLVVRVQRAEGPLTLSGASARSRARVTRDRAGAAASGRPGDASRDHRFLADGQGRFTVAGIPSGEIRIVASHPASAPTATDSMEVADGERRSLTIALASPRALSGRVFDEVGNSVDGARIVLSDPRGIFARRVFPAGEGGRFRQEGLPPSLLRIAISSPGLAPFHKMIDLRQSREHTLEAHLRRGSIAVEGLVSGPDGDPLAGARVSILADEPGAEPKTAICDEVGHFRIEGLAPGLHTVQVEHADHPPATLRGVDGAEALEIRLGGGGEISGMVATTDGTPVSDALVTAERRPEAGERAGAFETRRRTTEPEGAFRLAGLPLGIYRLSAEAPGFGRAHRDGVEVREADRLELNLVLPPKLPVAPPPLE